MHFAYRRACLPIGRRARPTVLGKGAHSLGPARQAAERNRLRSDQDSVYTGYGWLWAILLKDGLQLSYSERGARDNPWIELFWGRMKTEIGSRIDQVQTFPDLEHMSSTRDSVTTTGSDDTSRRAACCP